MEAPKGTGKTIVASAAAGARLAYYQSAAEPGVLAPRGWHCFGFYGSGGRDLLIAPEPLDFGIVRTKRFTGPLIALRYFNGYTSGRNDVAGVIARVFPAYRSFVTGVLETFDYPASMFPVGPYPTDTLTYKSDRIVEFTTPSQTEGLGTRYEVVKNGSPIDGVAMLVGEAPGAMITSMRLPPEERPLANIIVRQFEADAPKP